jgi:GTP-binding protein
MLPVVAIVGRPNVGKSTLFNRLTRTRDSLVDDQPGVTRDRVHGMADFQGTSCLLIDTGGVADDATEIELKVQHQIELALEEADVVIFLVDARSGNLNGDRSIAERLRRESQAVFLAVNKSEGLVSETAVAEFHELALGQPYPISARTKFGLSSLINAVCDWLPTKTYEADNKRMRLAVIGRPNVGKSTLVNALLGDQRMIVADQPGTTRDSVRVPLDRNDRHYLLIDTAGVRRKSRVKELIEKYSVVKTLQAIAESSVVILVLDAQQGVIEQDKAIAGLALQNGRSIVVVVNKWDGLGKEIKQQVERDLKQKFLFLPKHDTIRISALHGSGLGNVLDAAYQAHLSAIRNLPTNRLNRLLGEAVGRHPPPRHGGRLIQLKYAHQGGRNPPIIVIHGNRVDRLPPAYRRYLARYFSRAFNLIGSPVHIETRSGVNPYV